MFACRLKMDVTAQHEMDLRSLVPVEASGDTSARIKEPQAKWKPSDFSICIRCQVSKKKDKLCTPREVETYDKFLQSVDNRSEYGNSDFFNVSSRLSGTIGADLQSKGAQWHRNCYSDTTDKNKIESDKKRYEINTDTMTSK